MPLLLVDLDNTLIDRAGAVDRWAREFATAHGGDTGDAAWLVTADRDGLEPRERFAGMIAERFGLDGKDEGAILAELRGGLVRQLVADDAVTQALRDARAAGWVPFVVTNGTAEQQERKLRHTSARGARLPSVWLHRGRPWPLTGFEPPLAADSFPRAVDIVLGR